MIKLDLKDRKLLYELDTNSRQSYQQIGKKIGLSKDSVIYRIKQLEEQGIINQFHTVIDVGKLGYISFRLYLKLQNTDEKKEEEIIKYLKNRKEITWLVSIDGEYDLSMWILTKSVREMNLFWEGLLREYARHLAKKWLTIFTKVSYFPRVYFLENKQNTEEFIFITEPSELSLDKEDQDILKILAPNARVPIIDIAKKVGLTAKTVAARIRYLEEKGIIIGYRTRFDLEKLGYQYFKVHFNLYSRGNEKEEKLRNYFLANPNIVFDNQVLGGDDIEIEIQVQSLQELRKIISEIKTEFVSLIKDHSYMLFYKEHKFVFLPEK